MKTEVEMQRRLFGCEIAQKSKSGMFSATDIVRAGNKWRMINGHPVFQLSAWLKSKQTMEFIKELEERFGKKVVNKERKRGRGSHTWVHPLLSVDLALAISPRLKIEVYQWLYDELLKYRNDSGDSYKLMCGALHARHRNPRSFKDYIQGVALRIRKRCGVRDWQRATQMQLKRRDKIHEEIAILADVLNSADQAVEIALRRDGERVLEQMGESPLMLTGGVEPTDPQPMLPGV